jgi:divalent metal cation (Fe/Co/Zn/Cd) transporter
MAKSKGVIIASLTSNVVIAASKFVVAATTRSSAMLAEALHSLVDTANSLMNKPAVLLSQRVRNVLPTSRNAKIMLASRI